MANATHDRSVQYIGARYVPKFYLNPDYSVSDVRNNDWKAGVLYEALTIVTYNNDSYTSKRTVPENIGNPAENTEYWACTTKYSAAIMALQTAVGTLEGAIREIDDYVGNPPLLTEATTISDAINELVLSDTQIKELIETTAAKLTQKIRITNKAINGNVILDGIYDSNYWLQGATIVGNNIVAYLNHSTDNVGKLVCFNTTSHTKIWEYDIEGYHGGSVAYCDTDGCLYICGCVPYNDDELIDNIIVVDYNNPSSIKSVIHAPVALATIAYDKENDVFYGSDRSNNIYKFVGKFASIDATIPIESSAIEQNISFLRCAVVKDGIVYGFSYTARCKFVAGFNLENGKLAYYASVNDVHNGYRQIGEIENIFYDYTNERFIMGSILRHSICGIKNHNLLTFSEIGVYNAVKEICPFTEGYISAVESEVAYRFTIQVESGATDYEPWTSKNGTSVKCVLDAITVSQVLNKFVYIQIASTYGGTNELDDFAANFNGYISPLSPFTEVILNKCILAGNTNIHFSNCRFVGHSAGAATSEANIVVPRMSKVIFQNCTFDDYSNNTDMTTHAHIIALQGSDVYASGCTFGTKTEFSGSSAKYVKSTSLYHTWTAVNNVVNVQTADEYVDTGVTVEVPSGRMYEVVVTQTTRVGIPQGVAICSGSETPSDAYFVHETPSGVACKNTPVVLLASSGTYHIYVKRSAVSSTDNVNVRIADVTCG